MTIEVIIADDHPVVREGLRAVLCGEPDIEVVGECGDGEQAVLMAARLRPDVAILDLRMPVLDGADATARIVADGSAAVLVITTYDTDGDIVRAIRAGASGFLLKDAARTELIDGVRRVARGETVLTEAAVTAMTVQLRGEIPSLSPRESDVLRRVALGLSNPQIGAELYITEATVKTHVTRIFTKLGVSDRTAAVTTAMARGLLPPPR
ncbi:LuxR family two component transcriptional regulator [Stackebrandtia endophytica]|uniref:LuxR family two component transcriptional regulator n=1 Tax=Stackebrandtia endophytica TaxID=1496996 RepID=A0A543AVW6_9ACTN|nr:response regulator transcription factor [Stackebrandtia endophytica]TQL76725.1 LuxR family two component transcriptional regulator [Stackebrandtia endophytica]